MNSQQREQAQRQEIILYSVFYKQFRTVGGTEYLGVGQEIGANKVNEDQNMWEPVYYTEKENLYDR